MKKLTLGFLAIIAIVLLSSTVFAVIQITDTETGRTGWGANIIDALNSFFRGITGRTIDESIIPDMPTIEDFQLDKIGTSFEFSGWKNITITTSSTVHMVLSVPKNMVQYTIEAEGYSTSTTLTISGLDPSTTYYKYEDNYHNLQAFTTDATGSYTYTQDLTEKHFVFIQTQASTYFISDTAGGGDCEGRGIGTWNSATKTCTLNTNVTETIQIDSNGITLDCANHAIIGSNTAYGIFLEGKSDNTIRNCVVTDFGAGFLSAFNSNNTITNNIANNNDWAGIFFFSSSNNTITNNIANNNGWYGILLQHSSDNILVDNTANFNKFMGITLMYSSYNTITGNTASSNMIGIYVYRSSNNNIITNNIANSNAWYGIMFTDSSYNTVTGNTANYNNYGIYLGYYSNDNIITGNTALYNIVYDVYLDSTCTGNSGTNNIYETILDLGSNNNIGKALPCTPITGNTCVDEACCVADNCYEDEFGLYNHGMYVSCVADATKTTCGIIGKTRGEIISTAAKSVVNMPGVCANSW